MAACSLQARLCVSLHQLLSVSYYASGKAPSLHVNLVATFAQAHGHARGRYVAGAGTPGRLIRERYRKAADMSKVRGKLSCLLINDIDAGIGHFGNTQVGARAGRELGWRR